MKFFTEEEWKDRILSSWNVYGTGTPLPQATVNRLAREFARTDIIREQPIDYYGINQPWPYIGPSLADYHAGMLGFAVMLEKI